MKAIRGLPEGDQDEVLAYVLGRAFAGDAGEGAGLKASLAELPTFEQSLTGHARYTQLHLLRNSEAALILQRLAAGVAVQQIAEDVGRDDDLVRSVLRDVATRSHQSDRLGPILEGFAEGKTIARIGDDLGLTADEVAAQLQPTPSLTGAISATLLTRAASRERMSEPLRTLPVRFPDRQYDRLKAWCEANNFPMAVVVRGLVERFLDERAPLVG